MGPSPTYHSPEGEECETLVEHWLPLCPDPVVGYCSRQLRPSPMWRSRFVGACAVGPWLGEQNPLGKTPLRGNLRPESTRPPTSPFSPSNFSTQATCLGFSTVTASLYFHSSSRNPGEQMAAIFNCTATCLNVAEAHTYAYFTTHASALSNATINRSEEILRCEQCCSLRKKFEVSVVPSEGRRIARCQTCPSGAPRPPTRDAESFVRSKHQRCRTGRNLDREPQAQGILQCSASNACQ